MEQKISEIKSMMQAADISGLSAFINTYGTDVRPGVKALVEKARKKLDAFEKELARTEKMKEFEKKYASFTRICGIDEVGRGPLAGPVVAGAVILPKDCDILYLNDSKQLTEKREKSYMILLWKRQLRWGWDWFPLSGLTKLIFCRPLTRPCGRLWGN